MYVFIIQNRHILYIFILAAFNRLMSSWGKIVFVLLTVSWNVLFKQDKTPEMML